MKENIDIINTNTDTILIENEEDSFYFSKSNLISNDIKEDFRTRQNFLILFVNPKSGPKQGKTILEFGEKYKTESIQNYKVISFPVLNEQKLKKKSKEEQEFKSNNGHEFSIIIFNIMDEEDRKKGENFIKKYLKDFPQNKIKILLAGGDGTVMGVIEKLIQNGIPLEKCIFAPVPLGTGNDLSSSLGFGNECILNNIENLKNILKKYLICSSTKIDIWEIIILFDEEKGNIYEGNNLNKNKVLEFKKPFINYFSLGFDARLGFIFEQKRTSNRFCNKFIYGLEAFKRVLCCKKNYGITELFDSLKEGKENQNIENENVENNKNDFSNIEEVKTDLLLSNENSYNLLENNRKIIFKTKDLNEINSSIILKGNPVTIIFQNINHYMGGSQNIWENSSHLGITKKEANQKEYEEYKKQIFNNFGKQIFNDKKLEILTYERGIEEGLEKIKKGMSKRVYQGEGPFYFEFKKEPNNIVKLGLQNIYINIDGEYYHLENPSIINIKNNDKICNGQLSFLKNYNS